MSQAKNTIKKTVDADLCTGCGTCAGICLQSAICMQKNNSVYFPVIDEKKCIKCGVCYDSCPGSLINFNKLKLKIFTQKENNTLIGNYKKCYTGYSLDSSIYHKASSGGLVTELIIFALNEGLIDGAIVTRMNKVHPLEPEVFIAKSKDEILQSVGSKYCPVPVNNIIKYLLKQNGRYAFIGLPCHIEGLRKAELINAEIKKRIIFHFGLICHHTPTFKATDCLLKKLGIKKEEISQINYRSGQWPGRLSIILKNGKSKYVSKSDPYYWGYLFELFFCTKRCYLCNDKINSLADISFGDAWGLSNNIFGESVIIARSNDGFNLLHSALIKKRIILKPITEMAVISSQVLDKVRRQNYAKQRVFSFLGQKIPIYNQVTFESTFFDYVDSLRAYLRWILSSNKYFEPIFSLFIFIITIRKRPHIH